MCFVIQLSVSSTRGKVATFQVDCRVHCLSPLGRTIHCLFWPCSCVVSMHNAIQVTTYIVTRHNVAYMWQHLNLPSKLEHCADIYIDFSGTNKLALVKWFAREVSKLPIYKCLSTSMTHRSPTLLNQDILHVREHTT